MRDNKKSLLTLLLLSAISLTLAGCTNTDSSEYVTTPDAPRAQIAAEQNDDQPTDNGGTTASSENASSPDASAQTSSDAVQTFVAVIMDENGNIVTDENGHPVTTVMDVTKSPADNAVGKTSGSTTSQNNVQTGGTMFAKQDTVLYAGASLNAPSVKELSANTPVTIMSLVANEWYAVNVFGTTGYIPVSMLASSPSPVDNSDRSTSTEKDDSDSGNGGSGSNGGSGENNTVTKKTDTTSDKGTTKKDDAKKNTATEKTTTTTKKATTTTTTTTTTAKKTTTTTTTTAKSVSLPYDSTTNEYINEVVRLVNVERQKNGLKPLTLDVNLTAAAMVRATEIVSTWGHTRPDGSKGLSVIDDFNISWTSRGENIAKGYTTPQAVVNGWMNSDGHRANILSKDFTHIGVGFYKVNGYEYWVQEFCAH